MLSRAASHAHARATATLGPMDHVPPTILHRGAVLAFPDDQGRPQCRTVLERVAWHLDDQPRTAAWLMLNPSDADAERDDPTAGRVVHHSKRAGCPRSLVGNVCSLRTPYPADLFRMLEAGAYTEEMHRANLDALAMISAQADVHVVAYGASMRDRSARYDRYVEEALEAFGRDGCVPLYCLGTTPDGLPLHPLARGKFAVRNDATLQQWAYY